MKETQLKGLYGILIAAAFACLVFLARENAEAVLNGIRLCGTVLIPSLFPFFVCTNLISALDLASLAEKPLSRLSQIILGVGGSGAAAFLMGALGGYPSGAQYIVTQYQDGRISRKDAEQLLLCCNNAGPAFACSVIGLRIFESTGIGLALWGIQILSALIAGRIFRTAGCEGTEVHFVPRHSSPSLSAAFISAVQRAGNSALQICMFVLTFSVISATTAALLPSSVPQTIRVMTAGLLELSSGTEMLRQLRAGFVWKLCASSFLISFGGVSVLAQTNALISEAGLRCRRYPAAKLLQAALSAAICRIGAEAIGHIPEAAHHEMPDRMIFSCIGGAALLLFVLFILFRKLKSGNLRKKAV